MFYWGLLFLGLGLCVVVAELFVPSAGVLGLVATALIITAIVFGFLDGIASGALILALTVIVVPLILVAMIKVWPHTPIGKKILLDELTSDDVLPNSSHYQKTASLQGRIGVAHSKMLPSGQIVIDGEKYDAVSEGFAIEPGQTVRVVSVRENRVYVQPHEGEPADDLDPVDEDDVLSRPLAELGIEPLEELGDGTGSDPAPPDSSTEKPDA